MLLNQISRKLSADKQEYSCWYTSSIE